MLRKISRFVSIAIPVLLITACSTGPTSEPTFTPLNPAMFPPPGTPLGDPNQHTPVITPLSGGAATTPSAGVTGAPLATGPATANAAGVNNGAGQSASTLAVIPPSTLTLNPQGTATVCPQPAGWIEYTVQLGDTLSGLAQRSGIDTNRLMTANCLADADVLDVGQILYLPPDVATAAP